MGVSMKFTDLDQYLFGQGTNYEVYKKLGAHPTTYRRKKGVYFAVWAPNAQSVSVIGEFNDWKGISNERMVDAMAKDGAARLRLRPVGAADRKKLPEYGPLGWHITGNGSGKTYWHTTSY